MLLGSLVSSSKQEKETLNSWKGNGYKTKIQNREGVSGSYYYHCRIKEKRMGGLYYRTILRSSFQKEDYENCLVKFPVNEGALLVDVCKKATTKMKRIPE
jgi:hypothetical protein